MAEEAPSFPRKRVTRDVAATVLRDLLDHPPRATVAFVDGGAADLVPARARVNGDTYLFGLLADAAPDLGDREVVLLMDDGAYWFELRGVSVRGVAAQMEPGDEPDGLKWYAIAPRRILAWDYDTLREE